MTNANKNLLVIIPAYNEEAQIGTVINNLKSIDLAFDILVMNDLSTDKTAQVATANGAKVITNFQHLGYGGGLQVGYRYAVNNGYKYVIQMDADGQHDPINVQRIYDKLTSQEKPDIVIGSRFVDGAQSFKVGGLKKIAMTYLNAIINFATKSHFSDTTSGLQGLSAAVVYYYSRYNQFDARYPDGNVLLEASRAGFKIVEVPAVMHAREGGTSMHSGLKPIYYMMHMTASLFAASWRSDIEFRYNKARKHQAKVMRSDN